MFKKQPQAQLSVLLFIISALWVLKMPSALFHHFLKRLSVTPPPPSVLPLWTKWDERTRDRLHPSLLRLNMSRAAKRRIN